MKRWAPAAILGVAAIAFVWLHALAGLSLPVPWPDEAHFLWPARALLEHGTLAAPELHPERAIRWMPPGYSMVMAAVFAVTGPSLMVARHLSAFFVLLAALLLATLGRHRIAAAIVAALWLLSPSVIVVGNVARMEGLMLALALGGFACLARDRAPLALGLLAASAAVHPNGILFALAAAIWIGMTRPRIKPRGWIEQLVFAVGVAVAVSAWAVTIFGDGFGDDLRFQLERKAGRDLLAPWLDRRTLVAGAAAATLAFASGRRERGLILGAALAALVARNVGREMWYAAFDPLFYALVALVVVDTVRAQKKPRLLWAAVVALGVAAWPDAPRPPSMLNWRGMTFQSVEYVGPKQTSRVSAVVEGPVVVVPSGDAALFLEHAKPVVVDPVRYPFAAEATLVHRSPQHQRRVRAEVNERLDAAPSAIEITHGWFLIATDPNPAPPP